ncbi:sarcoglycan alpha isoform X1 [Rhynchophorus ferrugineus]|uniref:sarcoglycan alpha isoform X1 n=1 Tax=Rhynchophorus ferrugineus TaxID=354439 RepID=UPI003FCE0301
MCLRVVFFLFFSVAFARDHNVLMTEVFEIIIDPPMFNWTYEGRKDQFVYEASLAHSPDLPSWIHYVSSEKHHSGFLYGVPPNHKKSIVPLQVVGLNKKNYETRVENLNIVIQEKRSPARYEVHLKIDNLNVEDMFEVEKMEALKDIFRIHLWRDSEEDLYVTFLESAVEMGARKPVNPNEGEGVIVRLGSEIVFSSELLELQEEIRPLYKMQPCPRDYKRTSVERFFRDVGFALDWCSFRLIQKEENNNSAMHKSTFAHGDEFDDEWQPVSRDTIPIRSYNRELAITITIPTIIMLVLVLALTFILCFQHEDLNDEQSDFFLDNLFHICLDWHKGSIDVSEQPAGYLPRNTTASFQALSLANHALGHDLPSDMLLLNRSHTDSPNSTLNRGVHCRPSPPPYIRPKFKPEI